MQIVWRAKPECCKRILLVAQKWDTKVAQAMEYLLIFANKEVTFAAIKDLDLLKKKEEFGKCFFYSKNGEIKEINLISLKKK